MGDTPKYVISPETHFADAAAAASARVQTLDQAILAADCPRCWDNLKHFFPFPRVANCRVAVLADRFRRILGHALLQVAPAGPLRGLPEYSFA